MRLAVRSSMVLACATVGAAGCSVLFSVDDVVGDVSAGAADANAPALDDAGEAAASRSFDCDGAVFCDDFDDLDADIAARWSRTTEENGGVLTRERGDTPSPPGAFRAALLERSQSPKGGGAGLTKLIAGATTELRCQIDLRIDVRSESADSNFVRVFQVGLDVPTTYSFYSLNVAVFGKRAVLEELAVLPDGGSVNGLARVQLPDLALSTWTRISFDVDVSPGTPRVSVSMGTFGQTSSAPEMSDVVVDRPLVGIDGGVIGGRLSVGLFRVDTGPEWSALFDNAACWQR